VFTGLVAPVVSLFATTGGLPASPAAPELPALPGVVSAVLSGPTWKELPLLPLHAAIAVDMSTAILNRFMGFEGRGAFLERQKEFSKGLKLKDKFPTRRSTYFSSSP
jgi:hypothetical protein